MTQKVKDKNIKRNVLKEEGSSRAVLSGSYYFLFGIIGSILLWVFTILATGNPGLAYYGEVIALLGIFQVFSRGFAQSFIAKVKNEYVQDKERAIIKAASYVKVRMTIGGILAIIVFILSFLIPDPFLQICLLFTIPPLLITYFFSSVINMINIENRFDITGFIGGLYGVIVFIVGILLLLFKAEPIYFAIIPIFVTLNSVILSIIFFKKVSPYSLRKLFIGDIESHKGFRSSEGREYLKYSLYSTLTNLESIGLLGNLIIFLATLFLYIWYPSIQILAVQILTIVMAYAIVKVAVIYFTTPLNIEVAEAVAKDNKKIVQEAISDTGKIAVLLGLTLAIIVCAGAGHILKTLHLSVFIENGVFNNTLFLRSQILLALCAMGQGFYGLSALFGNALIGSGHGKYSAIGFGITLILTFLITPFCIFFTGFVGAGIAMFLTGSFVFPFMLIQIKRKLNIKLDLKIVNLIPFLIILFFLIYFFPLSSILGGENLLIGILMIFGIFITFLGGIPFFGIFGPGDGKMIRDITQSFSLENMGNILIKIGNFFYYLNPFHSKKRN